MASAAKLSIRVRVSTRIWRRAADRIRNRVRARIKLLLFTGVVAILIAAVGGTLLNVPRAPDLTARINSALAAYDAEAYWALFCPETQATMDYAGIAGPFQGARSLQKVAPVYTVVGANEELVLLRNSNSAGPVYAAVLILDTDGRGSQCIQSIFMLSD